MISHLLKSLNNKKSWRNNLTFSSISLGQNCLFFFVIFLSVRAGQNVPWPRPPSQRHRTPGFMASDRKSIQLTVCNPTIALSPRRKKKTANPVIKSLFKGDRLQLQPCHRRCLFKKQRCCAFTFFNSNTSAFSLSVLSVIENGWMDWKRNHSVLK